MKKTIILGTILMVFLLVGCAQQQTQYVCPDGSTVSDASLCPKQYKEHSTQFNIEVRASGGIPTPESGYCINYFEGNTDYSIFTIRGDNINKACGKPVNRNCDITEVIDAGDTRVESPIELRCRCRYECEV